MLDWQFFRDYMFNPTNLNSYGLVITAVTEVYKSIYSLYHWQYNCYISSIYIWYTASCGSLVQLLNSKAISATALPSLFWILIAYKDIYTLYTDHCLLFLIPVDLLHGNNMCMVFSFKNMYKHGLYSYMGFPNTMTILALFFTDTGMVS